MRVPASWGAVDRFGTGQSPQPDKRVGAGEGMWLGELLQVVSDGDAGIKCVFRGEHGSPLHPTRRTEPTTLA